MIVNDEGTVYGINDEVVIKTRIKNVNLLRVKIYEIDMQQYLAS